MIFIESSKEGNLMIFGYNIGIIFCIFFGASWYAVLGSLLVFSIMNLHNVSKYLRSLKGGNGESR